MPVLRFGGPRLGEARSDEDLLAVEEPLRIRLGNRNLAVAMRTPGNDDELAAGFLFTEGILHAREDVSAITCNDNSVTVSLTGVADEYLTTQQRDPQRSLYLTSSMAYAAMLRLTC